MQNPNYICDVKMICVTTQHKSTWNPHPYAPVCCKNKGGLSLTRIYTNLPLSICDSGEICLCNIILQDASFGGCMTLFIKKKKSVIC